MDRMTLSRSAPAIFSSCDVVEGTRWRRGSFGAGEGKRTLVFSLEGCCSPIELHPRAADHLSRHTSRLNHPSAGRTLTRVDFRPILRSPSIAKGGDPVSYSKRCHLAGIAR